MNRKFFAKRNAQLVVVLLIAATIKVYYSMASVDQLRWILAPTTFLVELVSGRRFEFESHAGYMSSDHTFLIAASCAGVNFLITAFLMLSLVRLWKRHAETTGWLWLPFSASLAYVTTVVANTVRISIALYLQNMPPEAGWLNQNQVHRLEGIVVYFCFLLALYFLSEKRLDSDSTSVWKLLLPLLVYYAVTLGIPLVNGRLRLGSDFLEHALFVIVIPLVVIVPLATFRLLLRRRKVLKEPVVL